MEKLIAVIKQHPCLWQINNSDYKQINKKNRIWEIISIQLNKPVGVLKKEWKSLRDGLRQAMRAKKARSRLGTVNIKSWRFERQLEFLKPYLSARTLESSFSQEDTTTQFNETKNIRFTHVKEEIIPVQEIACPYRPPTNFVIDPLFNTRKKLKIMKRITHNDTGLLGKTNEDPEQSDDLELFFKSMCESTRKMPITYQIHVKRQLMDIILTAQEEIALQSGCDALSPDTNQSWRTPDSNSILSTEECKQSPHQ